MADVIIELDNNTSMTASQALARAEREGLNKVIIIGTNDKGMFLIASDMSSMEAFWALSRATQAIFDG